MVGHEKVSRLPFCTCPCDILSLALVCILRRVFEQLVNSRAVTISPTAGGPRLASLLISVFTLRYGPGLILRGPPCRM